MTGPSHTAFLNGDRIPPPSVINDVRSLFESAAEEEQAAESVPNDYFFDEAFDAYALAESSESIR